MRGRHFPRKPEGRPNLRANQTSLATSMVTWQNHSFANVNLFLRQLFLLLCLTETNVAKKEGRPQTMTISKFPYNINVHFRWFNYVLRNVTRNQASCIWRCVKIQVMNLSSLDCLCFDLLVLCDSMVRNRGGFSWHSITETQTLGLNCILHRLSDFHEVLRTKTTVTSVF